MPAYLIVVAHVHDRDAFLRGYAPAAAELVERLGGQYVVRAPGAVVLEGAGRDGGSVVVSEWPDMAALRAFWDGPDYARIRPLREGIADCQVLAVESAAAPVGDGEAERAAAIADIVAAGERWKAAYAEGDMAAMRDLYEPDCLVSPNTGPLLHGADAVIEHFARHARSGNRVQVESALESIEVEGARAYVMLRFAMTITSPQGDPRRAGGRTLLVYRRGQDGGWRVWRDMDNSLSPDEAAD
jgi:uncharacterized protein (TIGR02246 family)